jgi:hypothetical protein
MLLNSIMDALCRGDLLQFPLPLDLLLSDPLALFVCDPGSLAWAL